MRRKLSLLLTITALLGIFAGCSNLDVVAKGSVTSFDAILTAMGDKVTADEMNGGWALEAPDNGVKFIWSEDYSKSPLHDVMLEFDAAPFIDAGLDTDMLPDSFAYYDNKLMVGVKLGNDALKYSGDVTPLKSYEQIVSKYRKSIGYHTSLDHYNVAIGDGNLFEWAKDMSVNAYDNSAQDKDIVFVLDPAPFIAAGVDPNTVDGWAFAKVTVDIDGKPTEVDKFLKPFNLK
ncbi:MAG: hypothetical protein LBB94_08840 [Clostridiales bacterium]|jgi:hypothetical protein|nr:hypothetical protein [Clostridiales bacterium]